MTSENLHPIRWLTEHRQVLRDMLFILVILCGAIFGFVEWRISAQINDEISIAVLPGMNNLHAQVMTNKNDMREVKVDIREMKQDIHEMKLEIKGLSSNVSWIRGHLEQQQQMAVHPKKP